MVDRSKKTFVKIAVSSNYQGRHPLPLWELKKRSKTPQKDDRSKTPQRDDRSKTPQRDDRSKTPKKQRNRSKTPQREEAANTRGPRENTRLTAEQIQEQIADVTSQHLGTFAQRSGENNEQSKRTVALQDWKKEHTVSYQTDFYAFFSKQFLKIFENQKEIKLEESPQFKQEIIGKMDKFFSPEELKNLRNFIVTVQSLETSFFGKILDQLYKNLSGKDAKAEIFYNLKQTDVSEIKKITVSEAKLVSSFCGGKEPSEINLSDFEVPYDKKSIDEFIKQERNHKKLEKVDFDKTSKVTTKELLDSLNKEQTLQPVTITVYLEAKKKLEEDFSNFCYNVGIHLVQKFNFLSWEKNTLNKAIRAVYDKVLNSGSSLQFKKCDHCALKNMLVKTVNVPEEGIETKEKRNPAAGTIQISFDLAD